MSRWDVSEPQGLVALADGPGNRNWRVETSAGPVLLRQFVNATRRQARFRLQVTAALAAAGLPVPAPIPSRDGHPLVEVNHRRYALYAWVDGRHRDGLDLGTAECRALGELLGRLHTELDALTPPVQQSLLVPATRVADALARADRLLDALPDDGDAFDALAGERLGERRDLLVELADHQPPEAETATAGYVHGDFHAPNLLYGEFTGGVVAILDWDGLNIAPYAGDLVRAATLLFGHGDERGLDLDRVEAFVRGHAAAFRLDAAQIQSAVHRLWWERLCDLRMLERRYLDQDRSCDHLFPGAAALVEWWTANLDRTLDVFAAPYARSAR
jgi:Ser/Thr protein kinase RdoA (MazF antagonist)